MTARRDPSRRPETTIDRMIPRARWRVISSRVGTGLGGCACATFGVLFGLLTLPLWPPSDADEAIFALVGPAHMLFGGYRVFRAITAEDDVIAPPPRPPRPRKPRVGLREAPAQELAPRHCRVIRVICAVLSVPCLVFGTLDMIQNWGPVVDVGPSIMLTLMGALLAGVACTSNRNLDRLVTALDSDPEA